MRAEKIANEVVGALADIVAAAREEGAAVAFGIIGMAEAIRKNAPRIVERSYWRSLDGQRVYNCLCPRCGSGLKKLRAGVDEGTDNELCGACRY